MFCKNCGTEIKNGVRFCGSCGQEIKISRFLVIKNGVYDWFKRYKIIAIVSGGFLVIVLVIVASSNNTDSTNNIDSNGQESQNAQTSISQNSNFNTADIVAEWKNRVAQVTCEWDNLDGTVSEKDNASALLVNFSSIGDDTSRGGLTAITNNHVIADSNGYVPDECVVGVYDVGARVAQYRSGLNPFLKLSDDTDGAYILLDNKYLASQNDDGAFDNIVKPVIHYCLDGMAQVGDSVLILGYPTIGTQGGITATEGIVSGIEGDYYVTSAKIDHGNSGGVAILLKNDCYLGIPTWVANNGGFESLGRILKSTLLVGS